MKKFLSLVVAALLLVGAVATTATAAKFTDVDASNEALTNAVDLLVALGVTKGTTDTTFGADEDVTRQQMAAFMYRMMKGGKAEPSNSVNYSKFTDLVDPYYNYVITWASTEGIIKGRDAENTVFDPKGGIILQDAYTMMVRALGYDDGSLVYPVDYIEKAEELDLDKYLPSTVEYTAALKRGDVAIILANMFYAETADVEIYYDMTGGKLTPVEEHKTLAEIAFAVEKVDLKITATTNYAIAGEQNATKVTLLNKDGSTNANFADAVEFKTLGLAGTADDYFLNDIVVFVKNLGDEENQTIIGSSAKGSVKTIDFSKVALGIKDDNGTKKLTGKVTIDGVELDLADVALLTPAVAAGWNKDGRATNTQIDYTAAAMAGYVDATWTDANALYATFNPIVIGGFGEVDVYDCDGNGKADYIFVKPYSVVKLDNETKETDTDGKAMGSVAGLDSVIYTQTAIVSGETFKKNDIALAYVNTAARIVKVAKVLDAPVVATVKAYDDASFTLSNDAKITFENLEAKLANGAYVLPGTKTELLDSVDNYVIANNKLVEKNYYFVDGKLVAATKIAEAEDVKSATDPKTNWAIVLDAREDVSVPDLDANGNIQVDSEGKVKTKTTSTMKVFLDGKIQDVKVKNGYEFAANVLATVKEIDKDGYYTFEDYTPDYIASDLTGTKATDETKPAVDAAKAVAIAKDTKGYINMTAGSENVDGYNGLTAVDGAQIIIRSKVQKLDEEGKPVAGQYVPVVTVYTADTLPKFKTTELFKNVQFILSNNVNSKLYENLVVFYGFYDGVIGGEEVSVTETKVIVKDFVVNTVVENEVAKSVVTYNVYGIDGKLFAAASGEKKSTSDAAFGDIYVLNSDGTLKDDAKVGNVFVDGLVAIEAYEAAAKRVEISGAEYYLTDATVVLKVDQKNKTVAAGTVADIKVPTGTNAAKEKVVITTETKDETVYLTSVIVVTLQ